VANDNKDVEWLEHSPKEQLPETAQARTGGHFGIICHCHSVFLEVNQQILGHTRKALIQTSLHCAKSKHLDNVQRFVHCKFWKVGLYDVTE
jgi:hypothetical protein